MRSRFIKSVMTALLVGGAIWIASPAAAAEEASAPSSSAEWPQYLHDMASSGNVQDKLLSAATAPSLKSAAGWPVRLGPNPITTQPIIANGLIYIGSWDGYEYGLHADGRIALEQYLGRTKNCFIADPGSTTHAGTGAG